MAPGASIIFDEDLLLHSKGDVVIEGSLIGQRNTHAHSDRMSGADVRIYSGGRVWVSQTIQAAPGRHGVMSQGARGLLGIDASRAASDIAHYDATLFALLHSLANTLDEDVSDVMFGGRIHEALSGGDGGSIYIEAAEVWIEGSLIGGHGGDAAPGGRGGHGGHVIIAAPAYATSVDDDFELIGGRGGRSGRAIHLRTSDGKGGCGGNGGDAHVIPTLAHDDSLSFSLMPTITTQSTDHLLYQASGAPTVAAKLLSTNGSDGDPGADALGGVGDDGEDGSDGFCGFPSGGVGTDGGDGGDATGGVGKNGGHGSNGCGSQSQGGNGGMGGVGGRGVGGPGGAGGKGGDGLDAQYCPGMVFQEGCGADGGTGGNGGLGTGGNGGPGGFGGPGCPIGSPGAGGRGGRGIKGMAGPGGLGGDCGAGSSCGFCGTPGSDGNLGSNAGGTWGSMGTNSAGCVPECKS